MPQVSIRIGGRLHSTIKFSPAPNTEVILHKSQGESVSLPALIDTGMVGDIQSWQCPVCRALLQAPAGHNNKPEGGTVSCPGCKTRLHCPAAPAKQSTCARNVHLAATMKRGRALQLEVKQLKAQVEQQKAQLFGVEVFDVDTQEIEEVVRKDVEPVPNRLKRQTEQVERQKKQVVRIKLEKDTLQTKLDEMSELALASGASLLQVNKIKRLA